MRLVLSSAFLLACRSDVQKVVSEPTDDAQVVTDLDGDGYDQEEDCDDSDAMVNPSAEELCDGLDNNCDEQIDEGVLTEYYLDNDADGYGDPETITESCEPPEGYVPFGSDCDDNNNTVHPSASEICDELDNDCNDEVDEGVGELVFIDRDEDGYGDDQTQQLRCNVVPGFSAVGGDCDDVNDTVNPDATEVCDELDNNCDGATDEGVTNIYYADADADGYGDLNSTVEACQRPNGMVENNLDCEDLDAAISPAETESCDGVDNNCDGQIDETGAIGSIVYFLDGDGDGYGDPSSSQVACGQPLGFAALGTDCDDTQAGINPGVSEICDGVDNDCNGLSDDDDGGVTDAQVWFLDHDSDGYGDAAFPISSCAMPSSYASSSTDCNDFNASINPGTAEVCDAVDNDCDALIDDDDPGVVYQAADTSFLDADADGFGGATSTQACVMPANYVPVTGDCEDGDPSINPQEPERCDGIDNNCDSQIDGGDSIDQSTWYIDYDGDGYGAVTFSQIQCDAPAGYVDNADDCNDLLATIDPGEDEVCDGLDNNCDGLVDGGDSVDQSTWYLDYDLDGYGADTVQVVQCDQPAGYSDNNLDCDDLDDSVAPNATEVCDGLDNDCDAVIDDGATIGESEECMATSCAEIKNDNPVSQDGTYFIEDLNGDPLEVFCEMDFLGGGWVAVYNMVHTANTANEAASMHAALIQNQDMQNPVDPASTSAAIHTLNLPLAEYQEAVFGWAPANQDVQNYGLMTEASGLQGTCYLDGYCGTNTAVGDFYISTTGTTRTINTGNSPGYPHVGLGFSGQIIVWGYDLNYDSSLGGNGHWGNWYDGNPCCNAGATVDITSSGWRYVIYLR